MGFVIVLIGGLGSGVLREGAARDENNSCSSAEVGL